jgi:hypothetical protein
MAKGKPCTGNWDWLGAVRPAVGGVVDAGDFDARATHAVGDNVGRFGDDQFPGAGDPAGGPELRVFGEEPFDAVGDVEGDAVGDVEGDAPGGSRVVLGDEGVKRFGGRGSIPETRGGSYLTHCATRSWGVPLPASREAIAWTMPATCHSLVSR